MTGSKGYFHALLLPPFKPGPIYDHSFLRPEGAAHIGEPPPEPHSLVPSSKLNTAFLKPVFPASLATDLYSPVYPTRGREGCENPTITQGEPGGWKPGLYLGFLQGLSKESQQQAQHPRRPMTALHPTTLSCFTMHRAAAALCRWELLQWQLKGNKSTTHWEAKNFLRTWNNCLLIQTTSPWWHPERNSWKMRKKMGSRNSYSMVFFICLH